MRSGCVPYDPARVSVRVSVCGRACVSALISLHALVVPDACWLAAECNLTPRVLVSVCAGSARPTSKEAGSGQRSCFHSRIDPQFRGAQLRLTRDRSGRNSAAVRQQANQVCVRWTLPAAKRYCTSSTRNWVRRKGCPGCVLRPACTHRTDLCPPPRATLSTQPRSLFRSNRKCCEGYGSTHLPCSKSRLASCVLISWCYFWHSRARGEGATPPRPSREDASEGFLPPLPLRSPSSAAHSG